MTAGRFSAKGNTLIPEEGSTLCMLAPSTSRPSNVKHCSTSRFSSAKRGKVSQQRRRMAGEEGGCGWQPDHNPSEEGSVSNGNNLKSFSVHSFIIKC